LLFICLIPNGIHSQNCNTVKIQKNKEIKNSDFYFNSVIDARKDTSLVIGQVYIGPLNLPQCAAFKKAVSSTVLNFLQSTYTNKKASAYLIKINNLCITELIHKHEEDTGLVSIDLDFYKYDPAGNLLFITNVSKTITDKLADATFSHDNRLKRAILSAVNEFALAPKENTGNLQAVPSSDILNKKSNPGDSLPKNITPTVYEKYKTLLQLHGSLGWYTKTVGAKVSALFFLKKHPKIGVGPVVFWNYFFFTKNLEVSPDVSALQYNLLNAGLSGFFRVNNYFGVTLDGSAMFGTERVTKSYLFYSDKWSPTGCYKREYYLKSQTRTDIIGGIYAEQGIQFMRKEKKGVNAKISVYESLLNAEFYETDFGLKITLGVNF